MAWVFGGIIIISVIGATQNIKDKLDSSEFNEDND